MSRGERSRALEATPPSPPKPGRPVPASVAIVPSVPIRRTALLAESMTSTAPPASTSMSVGTSSVAASAGPPSPS